MRQKIAAMVFLLIVLTVTGCSNDSTELPERDENGITDISNSSYFMEYNQLYSIMHNWKSYENQPVLLKCRVDTAKESEGFLCIIPDGTGCCTLQLELEFRDDIPECLRKDTYILGKFHSYVRDGYRYCQIIDAVVAP